MKKRIVNATIASMFLFSTSCADNNSNYRINEQEQIKHPYENEFRPGTLPYHFIQPEVEEKPKEKPKNDFIPRPPKLNQKPSRIV